MTALEDKLAEALKKAWLYHFGCNEAACIREGSCTGCPLADAEAIGDEALRAYNEAKEREQIMARGCKGCAFYYIHGFPRCCRDEPDACHEYDLYVPRTESRKEEKWWKL